MDSERLFNQEEEDDEKERQYMQACIDEHDLVRKRSMQDLDEYDNDRGE